MEKNKSTNQSFQSAQLIKNIQQQLKLPVYVYEQIIQFLKNYEIIKAKHKKQQKISQFKDKLLQNVMNLFQSNQSKMLRKLHSLQQINVKYMQRYIQAKKKASKSKSNLNMSLSLASRIDCEEKEKQQNIEAKQQKDSNNGQISFQNSVIKFSESIFKSSDWKKLLQESQLKLNQIQNSCKTKQQNSEYKSPNKLLASIFQCFEQYFYQYDQNTNTQSFLYSKVVDNMISMKKLQIQQNASLKKNLQFTDDIQRLKDLKQKTIKFDRKIRESKKIQNKVHNLSAQQDILCNLLEQKNDLQNLIEAEKITFFKQKKQIGANQFKQLQRLSFNQISEMLLETLKYEDQSDQIKDSFIQKLNHRIQGHKDLSNQSLELKLKSLQEYIINLQKQSTNSKLMAEKYKIQSDNIRQKVKELQLMKNKYQFYITQQNKQKGNIKNVESKITQKLDNMISKGAYLQEKQLLTHCLQKKDQLIQIQKQELKTSQDCLTKISQKMKTYFEQQGIQLSDDSQKDFNIQELFENYSKNITKQTYQKYPEQKNQMTKIIESKYQKIVQGQRQQYEERIQTLKQQLKLSQLQKDSYKSSFSNQQKQFAKLKAFSQKLVVKKADLQMQNSKVEDILKTVLDMMFAYLMSNISYQNLLQQIQSTIENIKSCLKYRERQRQKERENRESPIIDYRFSGLSAVSNDFSFSKLNKQSYCDYFNQQSQIQQQSEVISKISSQDQVLPPSRPSYSTNNQKRHLGMMDINQRATMAHQDESLLGYLNPSQPRLPRMQFEKNSVFLDGLQDQYIKTLESKFGYLNTRIPEQTIEVQKQIQSDAKQMYIKYKQALKCLEQSQKINQQNQIRYQNFLRQLKQQGVFESKQSIDKKLFYMDRTLKEQQLMIQSQKIQFETTISSQVIESQKTMNSLLKSFGKSLSSSRSKK